MNSKIIDKTKRLNYFYFIKTEPIEEKILQSSAYKNWHFENTDTLLELFHVIFAEIIKVAKPYSEYILSDCCYSHPTFFNEVPANIELYNIFYLSGISLFHHCILHNFKDCLEASLSHTEKNTINKKTYLTFKSSTEQIKLSATTDSLIKEGYLHSLVAEQETKKQFFYDEHQKYNNDYQRFSKKNQTYSYKQLMKLHKQPEYSKPSEQIEKQKISELYIKKCYSNPALFLFKEPIVKKFDKRLENFEIKKTKDFINIYYSLYESAKNWTSHLQKNDKILFDMIIEPTYGFSFFAYIFSFFQQINTHQEDSSFKLKNLSGTTMTSLIADYITSLPITYNRSIFFKYACEAIQNSHTLTSTFPPPLMRSIGIYDTATTKANDIFAMESFQHIGEFFRMLKYITIPLIEDLWDVLTANLGITLKHYQSFIDTYYDMITYDYTMLPPNILPVKTTCATYTEFYTYLYEYIKKYPNVPSIPYATNNFMTLPINFRYDFCDLIIKQCSNHSDFKEINITDLLFIPYHTNENAELYHEQKIFSAGHVQNIFHFTKQLNAHTLKDIKPQ